MHESRIEQTAATAASHVALKSLSIGQILYLRSLRCSHKAWSPSRRSHSRHPHALALRKRVRHAHLWSSVHGADGLRIGQDRAKAVFAFRGHRALGRRDRRRRTSALSVLSPLVRLNAAETVPVRASYAS